jgi:hypothetical protein
MSPMIRTAAAMALLVQPQATFAQQWDASRPVWDQTKQMTCRETRRYACTLGTQCGSSVGEAMPRFNFDRDRVAFAATGAGDRIVGKVFKTYPGLGKSDTLMSVLLADGRLFKFYYKQREGSEAFDVVGLLIGHNRPTGPDVITTTVFDCANG